MRLNKIKVLLVDDQHLMRDGLKTILSTQKDIEVVGEASNGKDSILKSKDLNPDVILMDIKMPIMNGVEATKEILNYNSSVKILVLTTFDDDEFIIDALSYGATGYILKDINGESLIKSVRDAYNDNIILPGKIAKKLVANINKEKIKISKTLDCNLLKEMSNRELEVAKLMVKGLDSKKISKELYLTQGTVKNYMSGIYKIIGTNDRTKAVIILKECGL